MELVIDYPNVLLAGVIMTLCGLLWHRALFMKEWFAETGYSLASLKENRMILVRDVLFSFLVSLVSALSLALLLGLTRPEGLVGVLLLSLMVFCGFVILPELQRVFFEKRAWNYFFISSTGYALMFSIGALTLMYL